MVLYMVLEGAHGIFRKATGIINCRLKKAVQKNNFDIFKGMIKVKDWDDSYLIVQNAIWTRLGKKLHCLKSKFPLRKDKVDMHVCLLFTSLKNLVFAGIRKVFPSVCSSILAEPQGQPQPTTVTTRVCSAVQGTVQKVWPKNNRTVTSCPDRQDQETSH